MCWGRPHPKLTKVCLAHFVIFIAVVSPALHVSVHVEYPEILLGLDMHIEGESKLPLFVMCLYISIYIFILEKGNIRSNYPFKFSQMSCCFGKIFWCFWSTSPCFGVWGGQGETCSVITSLRSLGTCNSQAARNITGRQQICTCHNSDIRL